MAERVSTGGNVQFQYSKGHNPKLDKEYKLEIDEAYNKYYDRKKKEKKRKAIIWAIIAAIIIILAVILIIKLKQ